MSSDIERRRKEIEAKKEKLAELRKIRATRDAERRGSSVGSPGRGTPDVGPSTPSRRATTAPSFGSGDVDDIVNSLLREPRGGSSVGVDSGDLTPSSSIPGTPAAGYSGLPVISSGAGRISRQSDFGIQLGSNDGSGIERELIPRFLPDLIDIEQELFELPKKERVIYNKEVQTTPLSDDEYDDPTTILPSRREIEAREREREKEREREREELDEISSQLDLDIEQELRELSGTELNQIISNPSFMSFIEQSSKVLQRALNLAEGSGGAYDLLRDYRVSGEGGSDDSQDRVKKVCEFFDERYGKNRSITDIDWSPKYPELSVASYNKNPAALNEPAGIVAVWNLHMIERPEFVFHSQSDVLSVTFSPFHSNLIFGGTYSGQILLWDTRSKHLPVLKTPLSASGHTHPVYSMQMVGTQNAHNLITASTDGMVCSWLVDMLAQPQESLELLHSSHTKTAEVSTTSLSFPSNETTSFLVGTEEGSLYTASRYDRAGAKAGLNQGEVYKGHAGPITGVDFHPGVGGQVDFGDLVLSSSVDWTVKLWRIRNPNSATSGSGSTAANASSASAPGKGATGASGAAAGPTVVPPIYSFDEASDYVYDVKWHPIHPAVFGSVDGGGVFDVWNLNVDTEIPLVSTSIPSSRALNKLAWDHKDGKRVALGGSDGHLYIYDIGDIATPREAEWLEMQKTLAGILGGGDGGQVSLGGVI